MILLYVGLAHQVGEDHSAHDPGLAWVSPYSTKVAFETNPVDACSFVLGWVQSNDFRRTDKFGITISVWSCCNMNGR
jgi:hypothetical protein